MRAFVAIELPDEVRQKVVRVQRRLLVSGTGVRAVAPESLHLTVRFLGEVDSTGEGHLRRAIERAACAVSPFPLFLSGLGTFGEHGRLRVAWMGLQRGAGYESFRELHGLVEKEFASIGIESEVRLFAPHLTLARLGHQAAPAVTEKIANAVRNAESSNEVYACFTVDTVALMRSYRLPDGPRYSPLAHLPLRISRMEEDEGRRVH